MRGPKGQVEVKGFAWKVNKKSRWLKRMRRFMGSVFKIDLSDLANPDIEFCIRLLESHNSFVSFGNLAVVKTK
jgi:hypothetical protein